MEVGSFPGCAALDALPQVLLAGGDVASKNLVQGDAAEAQADDLIGHLDEQSAVFRWLQFLLLLTCLLFLSPLISPPNLPKLPPQTSAPPLLPYSSSAFLLFSSSSSFSSVPATSSSFSTST